MILAAIGMCLATMVGPLDEAPVIRISRPGGGGPEFVRQLPTGVRESGGGVVVPSNAVGGGGQATVVAATDTSTVGYVDGDEPLWLHTEQLMRGFGYDTGSFGYTTINYPGGWGGRGGWHGGGGGRGRPDCPRPVVDPRVLSALRDLRPIESKFPPVPGR